MLIARLTELMGCTVLASRRWETDGTSPASAAITPSSPYGFLHRENAPETEEGSPASGDSATKTNRDQPSTSVRIDRTMKMKGDSGAKKHRGRSYSAGPTSPANPSAHGSPRDSGRYVWDRVKQMIVRSVSP